MSGIDYNALQWQQTIVLGTALRDGLIEAVSGEPKGAGLVAKTLDLDERAARAVLSALAEMGVLEESEDGYSLGEEHRGPLLERENPNYAAGQVVHRFEMISKWSTLPEILKTGEPAEDRTVPNFAGTETMVSAMRGGARESADEISHLLLSRLPEGARILDVGGGPGTNAESLARLGAGKGARVTVFDRPEVLRVSRGSLAESGVSSVAGDMNESLPDGPFECLYFGNASHMYGPEENRWLFRRMRDALAPGGLLVVREFVRGASENSALFAVNMLVLTSKGGTYTFEEYRKWLMEAGFEDVELAEVPGQSTHLILACNSSP